MQRSVDFVCGPKVEGKVAAVLPSEYPLNYRYAIRTQEEILDTHVPAFEGFLIYFHREPFRIGDRLKLRASKVKPWIDGQII